MSSVYEGFGRGGVRYIFSSRRWRQECECKDRYRSYRSCGYITVPIIYNFLIWYSDFFCDKKVLNFYISRERKKEREREGREGSNLRSMKNATFCDGILISAISLQTKRMLEARTKKKKRERERGMRVGVMPWNARATDRIASGTTCGQRLGGRSRRVACENRAKTEREQSDALYACLAGKHAAYNCIAEATISAPCGSNEFHLLSRRTFSLIFVPFYQNRLFRER